MNEETETEVGLLTEYASDIGGELPGYWSIDFIMPNERKTSMNAYACHAPGRYVDDRSVRIDGRSPRIWVVPYEVVVAENMEQARHLMHNAWSWDVEFVEVQAYQLCEDAEGKPRVVKRDDLEYKRLWDMVDVKELLERAGDAHRNRQGQELGYGWIRDDNNVWHIRVWRGNELPVLCGAEVELTASTMGREALTQWEMGEGEIVCGDCVRLARILARKEFGER